MQARLKWRGFLTAAVIGACSFYAVMPAALADTTTGAVLSVPVAVARVTLDTSGNVIDTTGVSIGYIVAGVAGGGAPIVRVKIDSKGNVSDASGKPVGRLIVGATDNRNEIAKVALDANGNVIDRTGSLIAHIVVGGSDGAAPPKEVRIEESGKMFASATMVGQAAVVARGGFVDRKGELEARIAKDLADNKITKAHYDRLSNEIESAARDEQQYLKDGTVTDKEAGVLKSKLDKIQGNLQRFLAMDSK